MNWENSKVLTPLKQDFLDEIGINKICTLVHRSELKDLIDLYFLQRDAGFDIFANLERARTKEGGLEPAMLSYLLSQVEVTTIPHYLEKELTVNQFKRLLMGYAKNLPRRHHLPTKGRL